VRPPDRVAGWPLRSKFEDRARRARARLTATSTEPRSRSAPGVTLKDAPICCTSQSARESASGNSQRHGCSRTIASRDGHMRIPNIRPTVSRASRTDVDRELPFHGTCWEVWHRAPQERSGRLSGRSPVGTTRPELLESEYIALGWSISSPPIAPAHRCRRSVMHDLALLPRARYRTRELLDAGYFPEAGQIEELVVEPGLGDAAGVVGAILMGRNKARISPDPPGCPFGRPDSSGLAKAGDR